MQPLYQAQTDQMSGARNAATKTTLVYAGTYTGPGSKGIYFFRLKTTNLEVEQNITLVPLGLAVETTNPSFRAIDARRRLLFAVNEMDRFEGKPGGAVSAFSIDPATGKLALLNQVASMGAGPCNLVLDKSGRNLLVGNYGSGSVAVFPIGADGRLGQASDFVPHTGKSVNPDSATIASHSIPRPAGNSPRRCPRVGIRAPLWPWRSSPIEPKKWRYPSPAANWQWPPKPEGR